MTTKLKQRRQKKGLLQVQLAQMAGIYPSTLSRFEKGWLTPTKETADRIAYALGCKAEELFDMNRKKTVVNHD